MVRGITRMRDTVKIVYGGGKGEGRGGEDGRRGIILRRCHNERYM